MAKSKIFLVLSILSPAINFTVLIRITIFFLELAGVIRGSFISSGKAVLTPEALFRDNIITLISFILALVLGYKLTKFFKKREFVWKVTTILSLIITMLIFYAIVLNQVDQVNSAGNLSP